LSSHVLVRFTVGAFALIVIAWLALGLRASSLEAEGRDALERGETRSSRLAAALDDARSARSGNAGTAPRLIEARLLAADGRTGEAVALASEVAREEPENLEAWALLYVAALSTDDARMRQRSLQKIAELNPQLAERLRAGAVERS
jgi:hypothetical protein